MAYQVLARKYRPQRFADVAGQDHVTVTLMNALTQNRIAHGYIFSGHRGIGKTSIARILACALNCRNAIGSALRPTAEPCLVCESCTEIRAGNSVDVIEIDAATNRGIDEIRELRDAARYRPSRDRYKIYILDEAHQITDAAFNALLKTLEEPPDHIVFMMATTQPEDIPQTIRSRCQHFSFHAVKLADILGEIRGIAEHEGVLADDAALNLLAEAGDGSMRDALSIMDQAIASASVTDGKPVLDAAQIRELMGSVPNAVFERILEAVNANDSAAVISTANELLDAGNSPAQLARQAVKYMRNCVIAKIAGMTPEAGDVNSTGLLQISTEEQKRAARTAALYSEEELTRFLQVLLRTFDELGYRQEQRFHFELGLLKLVHLRRLLPVEEVLSAMGARSTPGLARPQPSRAIVPAPTAAASTKPAFSPFEQDSNRRRYDHVPAVSSLPVQAASAPAPVASPVPEVSAPPAAAPPAAEAISSAPIAVPEPVQVPAPLPVAEPVPVPPPAETMLEESAPSEPQLTVEPQLTPAGSHTALDRATADLQARVVEALQAAGQGAAADAMADAAWTVDRGEARLQTELSRTMLPVQINPEAERIAKGILRDAAIHKLTLLAANANSAGTATKKPRVAKSGSAEARARQHPMVMEAQRLFEAEIQSVMDLTDTKT
jgi:DNA polymerase-3 subunit gamma/tau